MRFVHGAHPGRVVQLGYCMNLHAAEDLPSLLDSLRQITLPLRERLSLSAAPFAVGMYLPAVLAQQLLAQPAAVEELRAFLDTAQLDPFSFNAFPYGGFQRDALKAEVYAPDWSQAERAAYTLAIAELALRLRAPRAHEHISISTHAGGFGATLADPIRAATAQLQLKRSAQAIEALAQRAQRRIVLSVEAEPRSNANTTVDAAQLVAQAQTTHASLGLCLDACHSAVEFESVELALAALASVGVLGKLQYSSALVCEEPLHNPQAYAELLAMAEPRYLHQVSGRRGTQRLAWTDLGELASSGPQGAEELRCHFHVPVDATQLGSLTTTRAHASALLQQLLAAPSRWGTHELHVEIETYTWSVLPGAPTQASDLVLRLEREYRTVMGELERSGWVRA